MARIRVHTDKLKPNMIIGNDVFLRNGMVLVKAGTVVTREIHSVLARHLIEYVVVDVPEAGTPKTLNSTLNNTLNETVEDIKETKHFKEFQKKFEIAQEDIGNTLEDIVFHNKDVNVKELLGVLNSIIEQSEGSIDMCDLLYNMKQTSQDIYTHSINTALVSQLLGQWLDWKEEDIEILGLSGLLHDIGKLKLPKEILQKSSYSVREMDAIQKHPILGYNILKNKAVDFRVKQVILTHHERLDGSGYPLRVRSQNINPYSRILSIVDTYDIMTSTYPDKEALSPFEVVYCFEQTGYNRFDPSYLMVFLANILNNFIHYKVLLSNGQEGEVVFINKSDLSRPLVKVYSSFIDLSVQRNLKIVKLLRENA